MSPTPTKPTSSATAERFDGGRLSIRLSSKATQMGVEAMSMAARALLTRCSATTTKALPNAHSKTPEAASTGSSWRVGRMRRPRALAHPSNRGTASRQRMAASAKGGKPAPGRTATRMAR